MLTIQIDLAFFAGEPIDVKATYFIISYILKNRSSMFATLFVKLDKEFNQNILTLQFTLADDLMDIFALGVFYWYSQIRVAYLLCK